MKPQLPMTTVVTPCHGDGLARRVPEELAVVVGVQVDEARRHDQTAGIELASAALRDRPDCSDPSPGDRDVGPHGLAAVAVADETSPDHQIDHRPVVPELAPRGEGPAAGSD